MFKELYEDDKERIHHYTLYLSTVDIMEWSAQTEGTFSYFYFRSYIRPNLSSD